MDSHRRSIMKTRRTANPIYQNKKIKGETSSSQYDHYEATPSTSSCTIPNQSSNSNQLPIDITSKQGKFGWTLIFKDFLPFIVRNNQRFCSVKMIEVAILAKYFNRLNSNLYSLTKMTSHNLTFSEMDLMKHINEVHCDCRYGEEYCVGNDHIIKVEDAEELTKFLNFCLEKFQNPSGHVTPNSPCGFILLNQESTISYTVKDGERYVPLFYFDVLSHHVNNKINLSNEDWAVTYLRFCCKLQGIRSELFETRGYTEVIKLEDLKLILPARTHYQEYWLHRPSVYSLFTR